jgi:hypothetical protein
LALALVCCSPASPPSGLRMRANKGSQWLPRRSRVARREASKQRTTASAARTATAVAAAPSSSARGEGVSTTSSSAPSGQRSGGKRVTGTVGGGLSEKASAAAEVIKEVRPTPGSPTTAMTMRRGALALLPLAVVLAAAPTAAASDADAADAEDEAISLLFVGCSSGSEARAWVWRALCFALRLPSGSGLAREEDGRTEGERRRNVRFAPLSHCARVRVGCARSSGGSAASLRCRGVAWLGRRARVCACGWVLEKAFPRAKEREEPLERRRAYRSGCVGGRRVRRRRSSWRCACVCVERDESAARFVGFCPG